MKLIFALIVLLIFLPLFAYSQQSPEIGFPYSTYIYNKEGKLTKVLNSYLNQDFTLEEYIYDDTTLVKIDEYSIEGEIKDFLWKTTSFQYNEGKLIKKIITVVKDNDQWAEEFFYDEHGKHKKTLFYSMDRNNFIQEKINFYIEDRLSQTFEFFQDTCFNEYKESKYTGKNSTTITRKGGYHFSYTNYNYDDKGRLITQEDYYESTSEKYLSMVITYYYDSNNRLYGKNVTLGEHENLKQEN